MLPMIFQMGDPNMTITHVGIIKTVVFQKAKKLLLFHPLLQSGRKEYGLQVDWEIFTLSNTIVHRMVEGHQLLRCVSHGMAFIA